MSKTEKYFSFKNKKQKPFPLSFWLKTKQNQNNTIIIITII